MVSPETMAAVRYLTDGEGHKTDVLVPVTMWEALLAHWRELVERLEDEEDAALARQWLVERGSGAAVTISLDQLEQELIGDGLLPG
jgi:hypothetical protein